MNKHFNINRLYLLLKRDLTLNFKTIIILALSMFGLFLILDLINMKDASPQFNFFKTFFEITFMGSGLILTSLSFGDLKNKTSRIFYLTLPGSTLEKLISNWLITGLFFSIAFILWYSILSIIGTTINHFLYKAEYIYFFPTNKESLQAIGNYFVIQTGFLLGAAMFPKLSFMKTVFVIAGFYLVITLFGLLIGYLLFKGDIRNSSDIKSIIEYSSSYVSAPLNTFLHKGLPSILNFIHWFILGPLFLVCTYFELKEKRV